MLFETGTKLELNPNFIGIAEVTGVFPRGQNNYTEDHYQVMINGYRMNVPLSLLQGSGMFSIVSPEQVETTVETVPVVEIKPEVKTITKLSKKKG